MANDRQEADAQNTAMRDVIDKQAIHDLQVFYSRSIDRGEYDNLDRVFTADVIADYGFAGTYQGVAGLKETCATALDPLTSAQHTNGNHWADINGDTASAGCYFTVHMFREGTPGGEHFGMGGEYEDQLTRTAEGWRIHRRAMNLLWSEGNRAVRFDR